MIGRFESLKILELRQDKELARDLTPERQDTTYSPPSAPCAVTDLQLRLHTSLQLVSAVVSAVSANPIALLEKTARAFEFSHREATN